MTNVPPLSRIYIGFSTVDSNIKKTKWADLELIKRDLVNTFYTRKGERLMMPDFGSIIWDMLFEPMIEDNINAMIQDCYSIVNADGRVSLTNIDLVEYENGIQMTLELYYAPANTVDIFTLNFDKRSVASSQS